MAVPTETAAVVVFWSGCQVVYYVPHAAQQLRITCIYSYSCLQCLHSFCGGPINRVLPDVTRMSALSIGLPCRAMRCDHSPPPRVFTVHVRVSSACICARGLCLGGYVISRRLEHHFCLHNSRYVTKPNIFYFRGFLP